MPSTTKQELLALGTVRKISTTQFKTMYAKLSEHAIRKAYSMVRTYRALEANPNKRPTNARRTDLHGWEQTHIHHKTATKAISDAQKLIRTLTAKQQSKHAPP